VYAQDKAGNTSTPEFRWSDESILGSTSNIIEVATSSNFGGTIVQTGSGSANWTNWIPAALATGQYYWHVLTYKMSTATWFTSAFEWVYVDTIAPVPVTLLTPVDGSLTTNTSLTYTWTTGSDADTGITNYNIIITNTLTGWTTNITTGNTNINITLQTQGIYNWYVINYDRANNSGVSLTNTIVIDTEPPAAVMLISLTNNAFINSTNAQFEWSESSDMVSGISNYSIWITNINTGWSAYIQTAITNPVITGMEEGTNLWYVASEDRAGFVSMFSVTNALIIDLTPPVVSLIYPLSNAMYGTLVQGFQWSASDSGGIVSQRIEIDIDNNGSWDMIVTTNSPYTNTFTANGTNAWRVWAMDRAGNTNYSTTWTVIIYTNAPGLTLHTPINTYTNINTPLFLWSDISTLGITSNIIEIATTSNFGVSVVQSYSSNGSFTNWISAPLGNNMYFWHILYYRQSTATWYTSSFAWVYPDTVAPVPAGLLQPIDNKATSNTTLTFNWTAGTDVGSGITNFLIHVSNTSTGWSTSLLTTNTNIVIAGMTEGIYKWYVINYDYADNSTSSSTNTYIIDITLPGVVNLISPTNNTYTNTTSIEFLWNSTVDALTGVSNYSVIITNSTTGWWTNFTTDWTKTNETVSGLQEGTNTWWVLSVDRAGNRSGISSQYDLIVDITPPVVTNISPFSNSVLSITGAVFNWGVSDANGVVLQRIMIDTNNNPGDGFEIIATNTPTYNFTFAGNSTNWWTVWIMDRAGNTNTSQLWSVIINTNKIIVSLHKPVYVYTNASALNFVWSDVSSYGISSNLIQISTTSNFSTITAWTSGNGMFTNWSCSGLATARYYWRVLTYSPSAVTWYTSSMVWVEVDTNAPSQVILNAPANNTLTTNTVFSFIWNAGTDIGVGITNYELRITNSNIAWTTNIITAGLNSVVSNLSEGTNLWFVRAIDKVGNTGSWSSPYILIVDRTGPLAPALGSPTNSTSTSAASLLFDWHPASDIYGSIDRYEIQISTNSFITIWTSYTVTGATGTNRNISGLDLGTNWWRVRAIDSAGNNGQWSTTNWFYMKGTLAGFIIEHQVNYNLNTWGPIVIKAIATNGGNQSVFKEYNGTITIRVSTNGTFLDWTNITGAGSFTEYADGSVEYVFNLVDAGVISLNIRCSEIGAVTVSVHDGTLEDNKMAGPLYFMTAKPFIVSVTPWNPYKNYVTVGELTPLRIEFSRVMTVTGVNGLTNILFNGQLVNFTLSTNTTAVGTIGTVMDINTGLSETEDILDTFWLNIIGTIESTNNLKLTNNPFNNDLIFSEGYFRTSFETLIDKEIGASIQENRAALVIDKNDLSEDSKISIKSTSPSKDKLIEEANSKVEGDQFRKIIDSFDTYKKITGEDRNGKKVRRFNNKVRLYIEYHDEDNDGIVDGTDIKENNLKLFKLNEQTGTWELVKGSKVDTANNEVYADIEETGTYCLMADYDSESIISYPNPANINDIYDIVIRFNLAKDVKVTVRIYTVSGELVRTLAVDHVMTAGRDRRLIWDAKNDVGLKVVNGIYLIRVEKENLDGTEKEIKILKQGIIK